VLWLRRGLALDPQIHGGGQERGLRSGTPNVPGLAGLAEAADAARQDLAARQMHLTACTTRLEAHLVAALPGLIIHGASAQRAPGTTMITLPGLPRGWLAQLVRVAASGGSACSSGEGSHVLRAMGVPAEQAQNALRLSLGLTTTADEVDAIADEVIRAAHRLLDQQ
jgi:cysteine desulfurase